MGQCYGASAIKPANFVASPEGHFGILGENLLFGLQWGLDVSKVILLLCITWEAKGSKIATHRTMHAAAEWATLDTVHKEQTIDDRAALLEHCFDACYARGGYRWTLFFRRR